MIGVATFILVSIIVLDGIVLPSIAVLAEMDPISLVIRFWFPNLKTLSYPLYLTQQAVTYLFLQWFAMEMARIYVFVYIPAMSVCYIYAKCLKRISSRALNEQTVILYDQLYCINQIGLEYIRIIAGVFMGFGLCFVVFCNWTVITCWAVLPTKIYAVVFGVMLIFYSFVALALPPAINSNEFSEQIIRKWKNQMKVNGRRIIYWDKRLRARRPISFYYASTKFEKETIVNYYACVVNYTLNVLIIT